MVPALLPLLKEKYYSIRLTTVQALARFGPQAMDAVPALVLLQDDDDDEISDAAVEALSAIDPERFPKKNNGL